MKLKLFGLSLLKAVLTLIAVVVVMWGIVELVVLLTSIPPWVGVTSLVVLIIIALTLVYYNE